MNNLTFLLFVSLFEVVIAVLVVIYFLKRKLRLVDNHVLELREAYKRITDYCEKLVLYRENLVESSLVTERKDQLVELAGLLRSERSKSVITQAELSSLEDYHAEIASIEKELLDRENEVKEQLKQQNERQESLRAKNSFLKKKIAESKEILDKLLADTAISQKAKTALRSIQMDINKVSSQSDAVLAQIAETNEQIYNLRLRYDALDIEYVRLYKKLN